MATNEALFERLDRLDRERTQGTLRLELERDCNGRLTETVMVDESEDASTLAFTGADGLDWPYEVGTPDTLYFIAMPEAIRLLRRYRKALENLACLGNGDQWGNSHGNVIAQQALVGDSDDR